MEILKREQYLEYEAFVSTHPRGEFTQSIYWSKVKNNWQFEAVVSRNQQGEIQGACGILIQKIPMLGTAMMYCPRGPICDIYDKEVMDDLKKGIDQVAQLYHAHLFKVDTDVLATDTKFTEYMTNSGYRRNFGPLGFETIQARFNYRLPLTDLPAEEFLMKNLNQKTRYKIRYAAKHGIEIKVETSEALPKFMKLYNLTGERDGFNTRPLSYFQRFLDALGEHSRLYMGYLGDEPVCGAITTNYGGKCCYIYGASDNNHRKLMPNYLMQWEMIKWGLETNCTMYDFQGISGDIDNEDNPLFGLYRFKRSFDGEIQELAGEFDYVYRPFTNLVFTTALSIRDKIKSKH